jgi:hypothetical protein
VFLVLDVVGVDCSSGCLCIFSALSSNKTMANIFICTDFVHPNVPCIIKGAISSKDTMGQLTLTLDDIIHLVGEDINLTADVTPDGHGDCIRSVVRDDGDKSKPIRMFVKPHEERMGIGKFRDMLRRQQENSADKPAEDTVSSIDSNGLQVLSLHNNTDHSEEFNSIEKDTGVVYYSRQVSLNLSRMLSHISGIFIFVHTFILRIYCHYLLQTHPVQPNTWQLLYCKFIFNVLYELCIAISKRNIVRLLLLLFISSPASGTFSSSGD